MIRVAKFLVGLSFSLWSTFTHGKEIKRQFHAYSFDSNRTHPSSGCKKYITAHEETNIQETISKYHLWPNAISKKQKITPDSVLFGIGEALDEIWRNQHPKDCSKAKFLITGSHVGGFGSELHVMGAILGLAMEMGRVYLQNPLVPDLQRWEMDNHHCRSQNKTNLECYYEPWSSCTVFDAFGPDAMAILRRNHLGQQTLPTIQWNHAPATALHDPKNKEAFLKQYVRDKVIRMNPMASIKFGVVPSSFMPLLNCSPMNPLHFYYWWRAVSMTFVLRPNPYALGWMKSNQLTHFDRLADDAVGVYIRRGDKSIEMKLVGVNDYQSAIDLLWSENFIQPFQSSHSHSHSSETHIRPLFLASEDSKVIEEMIHWSKTNRTEYKIAITEIFDRKGLLAEKSHVERKRSGPQTHHPDEYLSMMLNLHYLLRSAAWVCTLGSNYCRLVDELRTTVAAKADHPFADLSVESCPSPPCVYQEIKYFDWR
jgi:hypothetical protein